MQRVIKRDGREVEFDKSKIIKAISCANQEIIKSKQIGPRKINQLANIVEEKCAEYKRAIKVEDINDLIEDELIYRNYNNLVRAFIQYRYNKELVRKSNTTDESILSLINLSNEELKQENSNKNPTISSTQRDYMAGEVSKDLTRRLILPKDIVKAHDEGTIHFHDMDYFAQRIHNCFIGHTTFVTDTGIRRFDSFNDGDPVYVKDKDGVLRLAHVRKYGKQSMNKVTLSFRGGNQSITKEIICTPNHRWILQDGSVTTNLSIGDYLYHTNDPVELPIETYDDARAFCLGFIIGDGFDHKDHVTVRLCDSKTAYGYIFDLAGFHKYNSKSVENDIFYSTKNFSKQAFLDCCGWRYLNVKQKVLVFRGLYAADGTIGKNLLTTADARVCQLIDELADLAGYHISSKTKSVRDTNFKSNAELTRYRFVTKTKYNYGWRVVNIESYRNGELKDAWCVEEPITHSFTLSNGIITGNCDLVNLEDMLQNGTVISGTLIERPHSFSTACNVATQIVAQVASSQYGGQSITLSHLAPFVDVSRRKIRKEVEAEQLKIHDITHSDHPAEFSDEMKKAVEEIIEQRVRAEVKRGVQTIQYQVNTLMTTNGQAPFITVFMYLNEVEDEQTKKDLALIIEEVLLQRYEGVKNEKGVWITPAFPKLIYVLEEDNVYPGSTYYYLTELAAKCSAKRLVPDYISEKVMKELKDGYCFPVMGCRSALSPWYDENGNAKFYGRWNKGVVTVNLPDVACSSDGENYAKDLASFWKTFDEVLALCHKALLCRYERLKGTVSDVAPILWQYGAISRLKKGETIDKMLTGGYSTISLGYAGLWECVVELIGKDLLTEEGQKLGLEIMRYMNKKCDEWNDELNLGFGIYGTPLESTTYKFAKALQKRHGEIAGVSDRNYITNSYHVHVEKPIDPFEKLAVESKFQRLSKGGAISYIETANLENNLEAVLTVIRYIYDNIMYAELNTKSDYCQECGWDREIPIVEDEHGKLVWKCPNCGNTDASKMNIARRTCGYIGLNGFNQGRVQEIAQRFVHLGHGEGTIVE